MKILEYTIRGKLNDIQKHRLKSLCSEIRGVRKVVLREESTLSSILSLRLFRFADEDTVKTRVERAATEVNVKPWSADVEIDRLVEECASEQGMPRESKPVEGTEDNRADEYYDEYYEDDRAASDYADPGTYLCVPPRRIEDKGQVSMTAAVSSVITAVVLAVLLTFSVTRAYMRPDSTVTVTPGQGTTAKQEFAQLEIIDRLFRSASVLETPDREKMITNILKTYVASTGDVYAEYYTAEELKEQINSNNGKMCGIGVNVVNGILNLNGTDHQVITVANVFPDSPAEAAGVLPGDHIVYVGKGEDAVLVNDVGYTEALTLMKGEENTECSFTVYRRPSSAAEDESYEIVEITATRKMLTTRSVTFRHYSEDPTVGIVRLTGFDYTTFSQFTEAVETLKSEGCTSFVLDLRGNPGGLLSSVEDVLVLFLQENDILITTKDAAETETVTKVLKDGQGGLLCGSRTLSDEDIGRYRDLNFSVLVNEYSASAAELFTSNIRDHKLGTVVGTTTYGKGCGQTTISLSQYGYPGALKLTTFYYCAPAGENYHGIGITPHVVVELSEEAQKYNINLLPDHLDNQLAAAVEALK